MKLGEIAKLTIPGELGYGAGGFPSWGYPLVKLCSVCMYVYYCRELLHCYSMIVGSGIEGAFAPIKFELLIEI